MKFLIILDKILYKFYVKSLSELNNKKLERNFEKIFFESIRIFN